MKRLALMTTLLAASALTGACGRSPAAPTDASRAPAGAAHDGFLGSGNRADSVAHRP